MLDQFSTTHLNPKRSESQVLLRESTERLLVELQGLQFLLSQEIIMAPYEAYTIHGLVNNLVEKIRNLGTTTLKAAVD